MAEIGTSVATNVCQRLVDGAINEADYLCCFKTHVESFEKEQSRLLATRESVNKDVQEARQKNESD